MNDFILSQVSLVIVGSAIVTYLLRLGGLMLASRLPQSGRFKLIMETLPGTILVALIIPGILSVGFWGIIGAICTAIYTLKYKNIFVAMMIGIVIVALSRIFD